VAGKARCIALAGGLVVCAINTGHLVNNTLDNNDTIHKTCHARTTIVARLHASPQLCTLAQVDKRAL